MNESFLLVQNLKFTLNRIVQCVTKDTADIHHIHEIKERSICHTGKRDSMLCTIQALRRKDRIKHLISGLVLRLVLPDLILHPV